MRKAIEKRDYAEWQQFCLQVQQASAVPYGESKLQTDTRRKRALSDYNYFVRTYFKNYADADCASFQIRAARKILADPAVMAVLEWPREHAKSVHAIVLIPMWLIAHSQLTGMILVGKNETDACNLLSDLQAQLQYNELFAHDFGDQFSFGTWSEGDFTTKSGIRFTAIGRDQSPRGSRKNEKRPNLAVMSDIDDDEIVGNQRRVKKVVNKLKTALYGALSIKEGGRFIMEGNRIHPQSILAHMVGDIKPGAPKNPEIWHSKVCATDGGYARGNPAWPERYTLEDLLRKFKKMGRLQAQAEYYHQHHVEGSIFTEEMIRFKPMPKRWWNRYKIIVGYFDPSFENKPTSDYKAVRVWGLLARDGLAYEKHCLKSFVRKCEIEEAFKFMSTFDDGTPVGVGVLWYCEQQFFNQPIRQALERHNQRRIRAGRRPLAVIMDTRTKENKYTRIVRMEPEYSDRNVYYNLDEIHDPDMVEGNNQLKGIEPGYKSPDDSPDADEGAWHYLDMHLPGADFSPVIGMVQPQSLY